MSVLSKLKSNDLLARVRETYRRPAGAKEAEPSAIATDPPGLGPRPLVVAVYDPADGTYAFDESLSQAERRQIIEDDDWFDRAEKRMEKWRNKWL